MNVDAVVRRAYLLLEDGEFDKAAELLDQALNEAPENAAVYVGLLCAELKVHRESELVNCKVPLDDFNNFKWAVRFGDEELVKRLNDYNTQIINNLALEQKKHEYASATSLLNVLSSNPETSHDQCMTKAASLAELARRLRNLGDFEDAQVLAEQCERQAEELKVLAEQRKKEEFEAKEKRKAKSRKTFRFALVIAAVIVVGLLGYKGFQLACGFLEERYAKAAVEAFNDGDYEKAKKLYAKETWFYLRTNPSYASDYSYYIGEYAKQCEKTKLAVEAFEYIFNGDYAKGNEIFDKQDVTIMDLSDKVIKEKVLQLLNKINPVEVVTQMTAIYWVNQDGTVGRIGGNPAVDNWTNIAKIKVNEMSSSSDESLVAGLKYDGTLICTPFESFFAQDVADFDIATVHGFEDYDYKDHPVLVYTKTDGTVSWYAGDYNPHPQCGLDDLNNWSNIKAIKAMKMYAEFHVVDPDGMFKEEYSHISSSTVDVINVVGETYDGDILTSAYNLKVIYPSADDLARELVKDIYLIRGWDISRILPANTAKKIERTPTLPLERMPVDMPLHFTSVNNITYEIIKDSEGKWTLNERK